MMGSQSKTAATCRGLSRFARAVASLPAGGVAQMGSAIRDFGVRVAPPEGEDGSPIRVP